MVTFRRKTRVQTSLLLIVDGEICIIEPLVRIQCDSCRRGEERG